MGEAKPTPGEWLLELSPDGGWCIFVEPNVDMGAHKTIASRGQWNHNIAESHANATLFHDAGTVFNTTGLTPSQLVELVKELEAVVRALIAYDESDHLDGVLMMLSYADMLEAARAALSKARPNTAEGEAQADTKEDAARYRYLRDCNSGSLVVMQITGTGEDDWFVLTENDADAAIDAARTPAAAKEPSP